MTIKVVRGDITTIETDVIVNAANSALLGGGGVDGAIHRAAGPGLLEECRQIGGCPTGDARITGAHDLPASYVVHCVGPVWHGDGQGEDALLESCHTTAMSLARDAGARRISFPAISCGVYRFPIQRAARIAMGAVRRFMTDNPLPDAVTFVCFEEQTYQEFSRASEEPER